MANNPVVMWELASHDQEKSVTFLRKLFDWELQFDDSLGFYLLPAEPGEKEDYYGGAVFTLGKARLPFLTIYVRVEDIEAKASLVRELGGHIIEEPNEVPGGAKICLFNEPSGVTFAMIQPAERNSDLNGA